MTTTIIIGIGVVLVILLVLVFTLAIKALKEIKNIIDETIMKL